MNAYYGVKAWLIGAVVCLLAATAGPMSITVDTMQDGGECFCE